jgi:hypothetical protein
MPLRGRESDLDELRLNGTLRREQEAQHGQVRAHDSFPDPRAFRTHSSTRSLMEVKFNCCSRDAESSGGRRFPSPSETSVKYDILRQLEKESIPVQLRGAIRIHSSGISDLG